MASMTEILILHGHLPIEYLDRVTTEPAADEIRRARPARARRDHVSRSWPAPERPRPASRSSN